MRRCCQACHFPKFRGVFREFAQRHIPKGKTRVRCADISLARCLVSIFWVMDSKALCAAQFSSFVGTLNLPFFHIPNHFRATQRYIPEREARALPGTFGLFRRPRWARLSQHGAISRRISRSGARFRKDSIFPHVSKNFCGSLSEAGAFFRSHLAWRLAPRRTSSWIASFAACGC